jgi:tRNA(Ile)-lysidine synthase
VAEPVVAVAWSGGRDSTALLHATLRSAAPLGVRVLALHVHHGLSPNADAWLAFCERRAKAWRRRGVPLSFAFERLDASPAAGESVEAWARQMRYAALRRMALAGGAQLVLLAQHRRDQAETFLLQALRGGGVAGLSGMPRQAQRDGLCWARPWLDEPREAIEAYVRRHRLRHIEDESNEDPRYARNRLRRRVWPALTEAFPQAEAVLAASAVWSAQASRCLDDLAREDIHSVRRDDGLGIRELHALAWHRRANVLRHWLKSLGLAAPASLIERLQDELGPGSDARTWPIGGSQLRTHRGVLQVVSPAEAGAVQREGHVRVTRAGRRALPGWGGVLVLRRVSQGGVPLAWLGELELRGRSGGEQFQAGIGRPPRSLKKQYQATGVAPWLREGPLLFSGGQLVFVPGLGLDARVIGLPGQPQVTIAWEPIAGPSRLRS